MDIIRLIRKGGVVVNSTEFMILEEIMSKKKPSCLVPILNQNSTKLIKNACLFYDKITPLYRTSRWQIRHQLFPVKFTDTDTKNIGKMSSAEIEAEAELEWLYNNGNGILDCPNEVPYSELEDFDGYDALKPIWTFRTKDYGQRWQSLGETFDSSIIQRLNLPLYCDQFNFSQTNSNKETQIAEVLLKQFPVLPEDTSWEDVIEWRNDEDAMIKLRRLKHWINTVSERDTININHLEEEVLFLLDEYEHYMNIKKKKYTYTPIRALLTTAGGVLETVAKLKLKDLVDLPFQIFERKILIAESEIDAPGRELAYIVATKERFRTI